MGSGRGWWSEQLVRSDLADLSRRVADDDRAGGHVAHDDRAGPDVSLFADLDPRAENGTSADAGAAPDRRAASELVTPLGPAHEVVVRRDHARSDEDLVLERGIGGDVGVGLDLRQRSDRR